jgi:hypothetical protein
MPASIYTSTEEDHSEKPLKLMIKKHMLVGIKYLCKTVREDHNAYSGSGTRWNNILNKYGKDHVRTRVIFTTHSKSEFKRVGLLLSEQWDIVDSNDWANLVPENGDGGGGVIGGKMPPRTEEWKAKQSAAHKGRKHSEEAKVRMSAAKKGKPKSEEHRANISAARKGKKRKPFTEEHRARMSAAALKREADKRKNREQQQST